MPDPSLRPLFDEAAYVKLLRSFYPRVISHIDRDPDSPTYGSCDRHHWMYRLHDFDSGVLQQTSLGIATLATLPPALGARAGIGDPQRAYCATLAQAINRRTVRLLGKRGFLDEYFPGEESLPGTVFAAYATLKSAQLLQQDDVVAHPGLLGTAEHLVHRGPSAAANQDVAAAAFLFLYSRCRSWRREEVAAAVQRLINEPSGAPRLSEYGGIDLGYATVTLNFLALLAEDGHLPAAGNMALLAGLLADFVTPAGRLGGEFASRSTTYFLPYGLVEAARRFPHLADRLGLLDPVAVAEKLDDRYLLHYCFPSFAMAAASFASQPAPAVAGARPGASATEICDHSSQGLVAVRTADSAVFVALNKGGSLQLDTSETTLVDCGYRLRRAQETYATAVIDENAGATVNRGEAELTIVVRAPFQRYRALTPSPLKTIVLRVVGFLGPRLNRYFKRRMIQDAKRLPDVAVERVLSFDLRHRRVTIADRILGLQPGDELRHAPASSLRLVPSAKFYQCGEEAAFAAANAPLQTNEITRTYPF